MVAETYEVAKEPSSNLHLDSLVATAGRPGPTPKFLPLYFEANAYTIGRRMED
jgi:hypothetical protein